MVQALLLPVFAHILLVFILIGCVGISRVRAVKKDTSLVKSAAVDNNMWPEKIRQFSNNYSNQFELPLLFYTVIAFAILTASESMTLVYLAWGFVASRYVHTYIHTTYNKVRHRFYVFGLGILILLAMWGTLAASLYF